MCLEMAMMQSKIYILFKHINIIFITTECDIVTLLWFRIELYARQTHNICPLRC